MMLTGDLRTRIDTRPRSEPCWGKDISSSMSRRHGQRKSSSCWRTCSDWWLDRGQFLESAVNQHTGPNTERQGNDLYLLQRCLPPRLVGPICGRRRRLSAAEVIVIVVIVTVIALFAVMAFPSAG